MLKKTKRVPICHNYPLFAIASAKFVYPLHKVSPNKLPCLLICLPYLVLHYTSCYGYGELAGDTFHKRGHLPICEAHLCRSALSCVSLASISFHMYRVKIQKTWSRACHAALMATRWVWCLRLQCLCHTLLFCLSIFASMALQNTLNVCSFIQT